MKLEPGNIWSGSDTLAVFTNPTELAWRKGKLKRHYPVVFRGETWEDVEAIYQGIKKRSRWMSFEELQELMVEAITAKLQQYPQLVKAVDDSGGGTWILECSHFSGARTDSFKRWEGEGRDSAFIRCLYKAYRQVKKDGE